MADKISVPKGILEKFLLEGRTALVTGAGQGIGRAFAGSAAIPSSGLS